MNILLWGLVAAVTAWVVCHLTHFADRWRSEGRKLDDIQRTLTPEYEQAVRRHPSSRRTTEPTILAGRFVVREPDPVTAEEWERIQRAINAPSAEAIARIRSRVLDDVTKNKGEQA